MANQSFYLPHLFTSINSILIQWVLNQTSSYTSHAPYSTIKNNYLSLQ